jgi:polysaccharide export outer membrane protein
MRFRILPIATALLALGFGGLLPVFGQNAPAKDPPSLGPATTSSPQESSLAWAPPALDAERRLAVGDRLSFRILEESDPAVVLTVASSGEIDVPLIGRVKAQGRTCKAIAAEIKSALEKSYYRRATIALSVESTSDAPLGRVFVTGQVLRQGPLFIPREEGLTVAEAILEAGGFADFANRRRVRVHRPAPDGDGRAEIIIVDVKAILEEGRLDLNIALQPGDYVIVPERMFNF